ncbi:MAG: hypothetical protein RMY36_006410 [Nostoc sp. SerVER01]|nr:hypothetical protein [Nostoc sp. SerVER01]
MAVSGWLILSMCWTMTPEIIAPPPKLIPTQSKAIAGAGIAWLRSQQQLLDHLSCATL